MNDECLNSETIKKLVALIDGQIDKHVVSYLTAYLGIIDRYSNRPNCDMPVVAIPFEDLADSVEWYDRFVLKIAEEPYNKIAVSLLYDGTIELRKQYTKVYLNNNLVTD